jgi:hypothetical protein
MVQHRKGQMYRNYQNNHLTHRHFRIVTLLTIATHHSSIQITKPCAMCIAKKDLLLVEPPHQTENHSESQSSSLLTVE